MNKRPLNQSLSKREKAAFSNPIVIQLKRYGIWFVLARKNYFDSRYYPQLKTSKYCPPTIESDQFSSQI